MYIFSVLLMFFINIQLVLAIRSLGATDIDIKETHLREMMKSMNFGHLHNCLSALKMKETSFSVLEKDDWESSFTKGEKSLIYRSKSDYNFFDSETAYYINLDDQIKSSEMVVDLTDNSISHCSHTELELKFIENFLIHPQNIFKGKKEKKVLLLGSTRGEWFKSKPANKLFSILKKINPLKQHNSMIRIVKEIHRDVSSTNNRCVRMVTEDIHYLELFENMKTETFVDNPYQNSFQQIVKDKDRSKYHKRLRELGTIVTPDKPVITCEDAYWGDPKTYTINSEGPQSNSSTTTYNYLLGSLGCVSYETSLPGSFNANYDFSTSRAATDPLIIPGVDGIECSNCYAFLGAGILAILQYNTGTFKSGKFFRVEIKIAGGAGFNVNLNVLSPNISTVKTVPGVMPAEKTYHEFPIGKTGLTLNYKFGGVNIDAGGSGQATGSFSAGAGATIAASAAVLFDGANLTFPYTASITVIPPFFKATKFTLGKSFDVSLALTATENFQLAYGTSVASVSVEFNVQAVGTTEISYTSSSKSSSSSNRKNNINNLNSVDVIGDKGQTILYPGDILMISFTYGDLPSYEFTRIFYSIVTNDGREYLIMEKSFSTNEGGNGIFKANWRIPSDSRFKSDGTDEFVISVRSSSHILYTFQSNAFHLSMFTDTDSIFLEGPKDGDVIQPNTPVYLKWNPLDLNYFVKDIYSPYGGKEEVAYQAFFNIVVESLDENGTFVSQVIKNYTNANILNDGMSTISFTPSLSLLGERFYITINSLKFSNIWGWSSGYFYLKQPGNNQMNSSKVALKFESLKNEKISLSKKHHRNLQSTCSGSNVALKNSASTGGSLQSASVSLTGVSTSLPLSSGAALSSLDPPDTTCLSTGGGGSGGTDNGNVNAGGISNCNRVMTGAFLSAIIGLVVLMI